MQRNFILTDIMKTGAHLDLEEFISMHSIADQKFDCSGEYYTLHNYDLDSYDRRFAILDTRNANSRIKDNKEFNDELDRRCKLLHSQGFKFIKSTPWESEDNVNNSVTWPSYDIPHIRWTGGTSWFWFYMYRKHLDKKYNFQHDGKTFDFLYLNKHVRPHRKKLFDEISKTSLLQKSIYSYWPDNIKLPKAYELPYQQNYPFRGYDQDIFEKPYNVTKYSLISETNDNDNEVFITEKLWKAIIAEHIFIVHGNHLYLQKLRELGFRTFSQFFDESYDIENNSDRKIAKIVNLCESISQKDWQDLYLQTKAIRKHNYENFFNVEKLSNEINKTINLFLEFFDRG